MHAWLENITPWESVAISVVILVWGLTVVIAICSLIFKSMDQRPVVQHIPTEEELRRRDEEGARRAYKRYTAGKP